MAKSKDTIEQHAKDYHADAWREYDLKELGQWVYLLHKRSQMRANPEKREKDLQDARNYLAMMSKWLD